MITLPTVNINGTSRDDLVAQYNAAAVAVHTAIAELHKIDVHGRDYPGLSGEHNAKRARAEHAARIAKLDSVLADLRAILDHVEPS